MREVTRARRISYRRRVAVAFAAAACVLVGTGFGAYALTRDQPTHVESIGCYDRAALDANVSVIGNTAQDPVEACADIWRQGGVGPQTTVPSLQPCVLDTGAVAVVPGDGPAVCHRLGIAPLPDHERAEFRRLGAVQATLTADLRACVSVEEARAVARRALDEHGLADWDVAGDATLSGERPCAGAVIERSEGRIVLIAEPR